MGARPTFKPVLRIGAILLIGYLLVLAFVYLRQRAMLFYPSHDLPSAQLQPWSDGSQKIGCCHEVTNPNTIWLMLHGNAGQAANRAYALPHLMEQDSLYVLEYPGYGARPGRPCLQTMNAAAEEAYRLLRSRHPRTPVCVIGESVGSGPACHLALENTPPDKIVLLVPFDALTKVAAHHFPFLPCGLLMRDRWDNVESLKHYKGPLEIYAAEADTIIPPDHAKALARQIPGARLISIHGGHNDWSESDRVQIRRQ
jgi:pimeloyl-ACP methyl ester carboxylesterase